MDIPNTYQSTLDFLYAQLPMFQRDGKKAFKKDLTNIIRLCQVMDNPQKDLKFIHVAGTNGKGSTVHIIAALLQTKFSKVGLYTSPHFKDYRERIKIGNTYIPESDVVTFVQKFHDEILEIHPSFFEITVAMAFWYFSKEKVDIVVLETGLGGRLDSTNIVTPLVSVITNIGFDHMEFLGDTLQEIALEKAGIIKDSIPIVIGRKQRETQLVFQEKATDLNCKLFYANELVLLEKIQPIKDLTTYRLQYKEHQDIVFDTNLTAKVQEENIITALATYQIIEELGFGEKLNPSDIKMALKDVPGEMGFQGRWHILSHKPLTIADGAHNQEGLSSLFNEVSNLNYENLHIVIGVVKDKNLEFVLDLLPKEAQYYCCQAQIPRALPAIELSSLLSDYKISCQSIPDVKKAVEIAQVKASKNDLVLVTGSMYIIAEIL